MAGIVGGVVTIAWVGLTRVNDNFWILAVVSLALLLAALPGLHGFQGARHGRLGSFGYVAAMAGGAVVTVLFAVFVVAEFVFSRGQAIEDSAVLGFLLAAGFFGMVAGLIAFGVATLRAGVLPRWGALLLVVGLPLGVGIDMATGAFFAGEEAAVTEWGFFIGVPAFAIGLTALSYAVWSAQEGGKLVGARHHDVPAAPA